MCTRPGHHWPLGSWAKAQDLFLQVSTYGFETAWITLPRAAPAARPGWALSWREGMGRKKSPLQGDGVTNATSSQKALPGLDLDVP